jgi:3',5'-cyclic AMP phosphodiesterase CpdA
MRTILHLSDLHFGRLDAAILQPVRDAAIAIRPDLTVISGDVTQRARGWQFKEAARFIESLPGAKLTVPGNHDVPLYNLPMRFGAPLWGFKSSIWRDPEPVYTDDELIVVGLNSARSLTIKDGSLSNEQLVRLRHILRTSGDRMRLVVCHHPFVVPPGSEHDRVANADHALVAMAGCRVDAALTGHLHTSFTTCREIGSGQGHWGMVLSQAGTISMRTRGEEGAFNVIRLNKTQMSIDRHHWSAAGKAFAVSLAETYVKGEQGWMCA